MDAYDESAGRPLSGRARDQFNGSVNLRDPRSGLSMVAMALWTGERPFYIQTGDDTVRREVAASYLNLVLNLGWKINAHFGLNVRGENLLDEGDATFLAQRPRRFVLSIKSNL